MAHGRAHDVRRQLLRDAVAPSHALQACGGQNNGVILAFIELAQASIEIAANRIDRQVGPMHADLRGTAKGTGSHLRSRRKLGQPASHHCIQRILPGRGGSQSEPFRKGRGKILEAVNGEIDAAFEQRVLDLFREQAFAADLSQGNVGDAVAGGFDDLDACFETA